MSKTPASAMRGIEKVDLKSRSIDDSPSFKSIAFQSRHERPIALHDGHYADKSFLGRRKELSDFTNIDSHFGEEGFSRNTWKRNAIILPEDHVVGRTSCYIPDLSLDVICDRITKILEKMNVSSWYHEGVAEASCTNGDFVKYYVKLYRGRACFSNGFIVEARRKCGCRSSYHRDCKLILAAAQGKPHDLGMKVGKSLCRMKFSTVVNKVANKNMFEMKHNHFEESRRVAEDLLGQESLDCKMKGMEMICFLMIENQGCIETAKKTFCKESSTFKTMSLFLDDKANFSHEYALEVKNRQQKIGLNVLLNALTLMNANGTLDCTLTENSIWVMDFLKPILDKVSCSHSANGVLSKKCMEILLQHNI